MKRIILIIGALLIGLTLQAQVATYTCRYWFDQNHAQAVTTTFGENGWEAELDVGQLSDGLHALHLHVLAADTVSVLNIEHDSLYHERDTVIMKWSAPQSYFFLKVNDTPSEALVYHCWFDQDFEHRQSDVLGNGHLLLDVADLEDGIHTVNVMVEGSALTATQSYSFLKVAIEDPTAGMQYHCWFDQDYNTLQTGFLTNGAFQLDVSALPNGLHTVNVQIDNGTLTAPQAYLFYKIPLGGYGVARWEYWLNDDFDNRNITTISPSLDTLDIISLLPVGHPSIRSSCFHFHPNGEEPYINAKNLITFRFFDTETRFFDKSAYYVDEQVQQDIVATVFERNTTESFAAPRDNQIQWFKMDAIAVDYLSFQADIACTMQLFAPSGEEVYAVSGPESILLAGLNVWEEGTYYLAVHDVSGSGETVSVTYNWLNKYAIVSYDVHLVGNGGCSTLVLQGNGFNSLLDAYLVNTQNDTIRDFDIGHESNITATATFDFYGVNLGMYDAVFNFVDDVIRVQNAIQVEEPTPILLTNSVSYPTSFMSGTPVKYSYTITNHGNMSAYKIPIFIYVSTLLSGNVEHIELDGLELPSLIDGMSTDSLSEAEVMELRQLSDRIGDLHHFFAFKSVDEDTGDSIRILSNYFFLNLAPFESRVVDVIVTARTGAHKPLNVWLTVPNDTVQPLVISERGIRDQYCCVKEKVECVLNITSDISDLLSNIPGAWGVAAEITDCATTTLSTLSSSIGYWVCREEGGPSLDDYFALEDSKDSYASLIAKCFKDFLYKWKFLRPILDKLDEEGADGLETLMGIKQDISDCVTAFTKTTPDCPPGDAEGGASDGRTPGDPNDILGYLSESGSHYMRPEIQNVQYEIEFENDTTLATAAAHTIIVRDTLDASKFDLNSLAARSVTIGDKRLDLNGEQTFARTLDMRPELYVIAQINQDYDPTTGIVEWTIQSLDPMTMEPTDDPNQGVLPVNYFGNGVGFIDYSINLKQAFADGTAIRNRAGIIFDQEEVIMTPTWTNTVDAVKPTSHIEEVTPVADSLSFSFVSEDNRSGVWYHSLYYRNASTEQEWQVRKAQIFEDSFVLHFEDLLTTEYLVIAVDSAGNREDKDMVAEYIYTASGLHFVSEGNWSTASNWQEGTLPEADDVAFINAPCQLDQDAEVAALAISDDQTLTVQSGKTLTVTGNLTNTSTTGLVIKDGAQLINATSNVAATMEKGIAAYPSSGPDGWYTIASPMDEMPIAESDFLTPNFDLYRFDETNLTHEEWQNYKANHPDFATFEKGRGYLYANSNSFAPAFMGTLSNTAATYHLTYTERPDALSGFNLIGNPFPHVIYKGAGGAIDNAQLASGYYTLTNEGAWHVHTYEDAIMPGQGILVKTMAGLDLTIAKSNATALSESSDAKASSSRVVLKVSGSWGEDRAFVYFGQGIGLDKMENLSRTVPSLWIRDNGHDYAIAHVDSDCESLELFFSNMQSGDFTLSVDVSDTSFSVLQLTDRITGVTIDLLQQPSYVFHSAGQENEARFSLTFKMETMR